MPLYNCEMCWKNTAGSLGSDEGKAIGNGHLLYQPFTSHALSTDVPPQYQLSESLNYKATEHMEVHSPVSAAQITHLSLTEH